MSRPRICRRVGFNPEITYFKPAGVRMADLKESVITFDEFEAVRLKDLLSMDQGECAKKMKISQPTFHRLVVSARKKIADAIINGKAIRVEGGNYRIINQGRLFGSGRMGGPYASGPTGECVCPKCGFTISHQRGIPCYKQMCPKCEVMMVRKNRPMR